MVRLDFKQGLLSITGGKDKEYKQDHYLKLLAAMVSGKVEASFLWIVKSSDCST